VKGGPLNRKEMIRNLGTSGRKNNGRSEVLDTVRLSLSILNYVQELEQNIKHCWMWFLKYVEEICKVIINRLL